MRKEKLQKRAHPEWMIWNVKQIDGKRRLQEMFDNRTIAKIEKRTIGEQCIVDGEKYTFDYDLARFLTQDEIENGVVFNYDLELQEETN